ncbi:MAG: hypothetical protein U0892_12990 [Pirellulales bacterium]
MPVRIYALAKELKLDSKDLVDLCTRIGILNKGSALASLEDDEVARVKKHLANQNQEESSQGGSSTASGHGGIGAPIRSAAPVRTSQIPTLKSPAKPAPVAPPARVEPPKPEPVPEAPAPEPEVPPAAPLRPAAVAPVEIVEPAAPSTMTTATAKPTDADSARAPMSREDYIAPAAASGNRVRVLGTRRSAPAGSKPEGSGDERRKPTPAQRREPVIKLANIPKSGQAPPPPPKANEPAPQKPEFKLTKDLISGHKAGMKAPLDDIAKNAANGEAQRNRPKGQPQSAGGPGIPAKEGGLTQFKAAADKAKGSKHKGRTAEEEEEAKGAAGIAAARAERTKRRRPAGKGGVEEEAKKEEIVVATQAESCIVEAQISLRRVRIMPCCNSRVQFEAFQKQPVYRPFWSD